MSAAVTPIDGIAPARRRGRWLRGIAWLLLALGLLVLGAALALWHGVVVAPLDIVINGEHVVEGWDLQSMSISHLAMKAVIVAVALCVALLVVVLALLSVAAVLVPTLLVVLALVLLVVGLVVVIVLSPLWLTAWLLWRAARPAPRSTTMAA